MGPRAGKPLMPLVTFHNKMIEVRLGSNLRRALLKNRCELYNDSARLLNCRGRGTCGTCAVKIEGEVSPMEGRERRRLNFPPHKKDAGLRLACQCQVLGDIKVRKHPGFWGHKIDE